MVNQFFIKLVRGIRELDGLDFFMGKAKLSQTEFRLILEVILEGEKGCDIISSELARRLGITRSAVSQLVTRLEERDVIKRVASPTDKKIAYIKLSDKAIAVFNEQCTRANKVIKLVTEEFGQERLEKLMADFDEFSAAYMRVRKEIDTVEGKEC